MSGSILTISDITIKQDSFGRFCLNDLHKAAGSEKRHSPNYWLSIQQTKELIDELSNYDTDISVSKISPVETVRGRGKQQGTFVVKELIYSYAMWISAKFQITVIRAYDAMVNKKPYGLKEKVYPEMVAKPHFITREMKRHLKHHVDTLERESNLSRLKIWRDFNAHFCIDSYEDLPMQNYPAACAYFEIKPIYTPESENNFVYVDAAKLGGIQSEISQLRQENGQLSLWNRSYKEIQTQMFYPEEATKRLKELGFTVTSDADEKSPLAGYRLTYEDFIRLINECNACGYYMVKKTEVVKAATNVLDLV